MEHIEKQYPERTPGTAANTELREPTPAPLVRLAPPARRRTTLLAVVLMVGLALLTFGLRAFALGSSFDIFIDEISYVRVGQELLANGRVYLYDKPFYLHPPAFFFAEAAYLQLVHPTGSFIQQIYSLRLLNVLFASVTSAALFWAARRAGGWQAGIIAAVLFAIDPFIIKMNSLVLLDTSAACYMALGYAVLLGGMSERAQVPTLAEWVLLSWPRVGRQLRRVMAVGAVPNAQTALAWWRAVAAGLLFGLAILTKDMMVFLTLLPLGLCLASAWVLPRRTVLLIIGVAMLVYACYPAMVIATGDWAHFSDEKFHGLKRLSGMVRETGVNRSGGPSLQSVLVGRLAQFGTTYALMAVGALGVLVLFMRGGAVSRMVGLWSASGYVLIVYCVFIGTLEEQFFYFLVVPCVVAIGVAVYRLGLVDRRRARLLVPLRAAGALGAALVLGWGSYQWWQVHTQPDNVHEQVITYIEQLPTSEKVSATSQMLQFMLEQHATGPWTLWKQPDDLEPFHPTYVVISPYQLRWNFGADAEPLITWLDQHGTRVQTWQGRKDSEVRLYQLPSDPALYKTLGNQGASRSS